MRITIKRALLAGVILLVGLAFTLSACVPPYRATPANQIPNLTSHQVQHAGHALHYVEAGTPGKPLVVFIHGTPGSWQAFNEYLQHPQLAANTHMLAVDRPGLGRSAASGPQPAFAVQAAAVARLFAHNLGSGPSILVGHSLGGSIAFRVAVDYPDAVGGLLSVSSSIDPELGKPRWYNRLGNLPLVRWLVRGGLGIANAEIMQLQRQLSDMKNQVQQLPIPITVLQGSNDSLVRPANAAYAQAQLQSNQLRVVEVPNAGHFLIWEEPERIVAEILRLTQLVAATNEPVYE